jgi:hypothetical protein
LEIFGSSYQDQHRRRQFQQSIAAKMSKSLIPSRGLLSSFSQCLRMEKNQLGGGGGIQCRNLFTSNVSTSTYTPLSRTRVGMSRGEMGASTRHFSTSSRRAYKTVEEQRSRYRSGVCLPVPFCPLHNTSPLHHAIDRLRDPTKPIPQTLCLTLIRNFIPPSPSPSQADSTPHSPSPTAQASSSSSQAPP